MQVNKRLVDVLNKARELTSPDLQEREKVKRIVNEVVQALRVVITSHKLDAIVEVEGSIAKDTWLPGNKDIDIFILFNKKTSIEELRYWGLNIGYEVAKKLNCDYEERYAEHPYLRIIYKGYEVDLVPSYEVKSSDEIITAVDRTRLHTRYVLSKTNEELRSEIRLLKKFMRTIGTYGAEIKVGGFSGYLCELLIIYYGSFTRVLEAASNWRPWRVIIDLERHYNEEDYDKLRKAFKSPLIIIDPVDKTRNAAAAVTLQKFNEFVVASRTFLNKPSIEFFVEETIAPLSYDELKRELEIRGTSTLALKFELERSPPDVLWGQLNRTLKNLLNLFKQYKFEVINWGAWSNDRDVAILLFELSDIKLPNVELHYGPPVGSPKEVNFLEKYLDGGAIAGPFILGNRWYVIRRRRYTHAVDLILKRGHLAGLAKRFLKSFKEGKVKVYINENILEAIESEDYLKYLRKWLFKKYHWLSL